MHFSTQVPVELLDRLKQVASRRGVSLHDLVVQAFELLVWCDEQQQAGATFLLEAADGEVSSVVVGEHLGAADSGGRQ